MTDTSTEPETIVAAAIRIAVPEEMAKETWNGEAVYPAYVVVSAPPPARHPTIMQPMFDLTGRTVGSHDQGFLTSSGRYVDRVEALDIAISAGQPLIDHPSRCSHKLYSEDLW